jgi:uncharacterized protein (TIGR00106 family)
LECSAEDAASLTAISKSRTEEAHTVERARIVLACPASHVLAFSTILLDCGCPPGGGPMKVIADLCVVPIGIGTSVSKEVAACERVLAEAGLKTKLHAYGTNIEGEWDDVFAAIKRCHEVVHAMGVPRITSSLRFGTRTDREQHMEDKIRSVEEKLR